MSGSSLSPKGSKIRLKAFEMSENTSIILLNDIYMSKISQKKLYVMNLRAVRNIFCELDKPDFKGRFIF